MLGFIPVVLVWSLLMLSGGEKNVSNRNDLLCWNFSCGSGFFVVDGKATVY